MKIWLKRVLISLVVLLIAALIGIAIFLLTFDPNAYKSKLEQIVYERYHRILSIEGDIELSLFPRIGLAVQNVSLSDRDSGDTFASIDSARFAVAIWPLLSNRLVVDHVAVTGFKAWLVRDQQGHFNFRDLVRDGAHPLLSAAGAMAMPAFAGAEPSGRQPVSRQAPVAFSAQRPDSRASSRLDAEGANDAPRSFSERIGKLVASASPIAPADKADFQIDIAGLDLKGGEIHLLDRKSGSIGRIVALEMNTGRMTFDQAFDVAFKGKLLGDWPHADARLEGQALVRLDPRQQTYAAQRVNLLVGGKLGALVARSLSLRGNLAYSAYSQMFSASSLELQVQGDIESETPVSGLDASLSVPNLRADRSEAALQLTRVAFRAKGDQSGSRFDVALDAPLLSISPETAEGEPLTGTVKITEDGDVLGISLEMSGVGGDAYNLTLKELKVNGAYKQAGRVVGVQMSSPAAWSPFGRRGGLSAMKGDVRIEDAALPGGSFEFPFIGSMRADLYKDELTSEINAVFSGSKIDFSLAASQLSHPRVAFDLSADSVDLNQVFPSAARRTAGETAEQESESDDVDEASSSADKEAAPPVRPFDWSFLDAANIQGRVSVDALQAGDVELSKLKAGIRAENGVLRIGDLAADVYGGSVRSDISMTSSHEVMLDLTLSNVDMEPLVRGLTHRQRLAGRGDVSVQLTSRGDTSPALFANLDGTAKLRVHDGALIGLDLLQTLAEANEVLRNAFSGQLPRVANRLDSMRRTAFTALSAETRFTKGQGRIEALELRSPSLTVREGEPATLDLVNQQFDVMLNVKAHPQDDDESAPARSGLQGVTVPVRVSGPFGSPRYQVQWQDIRHRVVKDAIQEGLLDILSQGAGDGPFLFVPQDEADSSKRDTLKSIGDALKGLLKQ